MLFLLVGKYWGGSSSS